MTSTEEPLYLIADAVTGEPWKIGCAWPFAQAQDRLARAQTHRPDRTWELVRCDDATPRSQLGID